LRFVYCNLEFIWPNFKIRGACNLLFSFYPGSTIAVQVLALTTAPKGPLFPNVVSEKA
jgi:hypothetical protein